MTRRGLFQVPFQVWSSAAGPAVVEVAGERLARGVDGLYRLPLVPYNLKVFRNGVRQCAGLDYWLNGSVVSPAFAWAVDSLVLVDYQVVRV